MEWSLEKKTGITGAIGVKRIVLYEGQLSTVPEELLTADEMVGFMDKVILERARGEIRENRKRSKLGAKGRLRVEGLCKA